MADEEQDRLDEIEAEIQAAKHQAEADGMIEDPNAKKHYFSDEDSPEVDAAEHDS
jgi:hypothetical protein